MPKGKDGSVKPEAGREDPAPPVATTPPTRERAAHHPDYLAWQQRGLAGLQRLSKDEDARRESGKRLW